MAITYTTQKNREAFPHAGRYRFVMAFLSLFTLSSCSSEQLQTFSETLRAMNDDIRSTNPTTYQTIPQPLSQPSPSPWCIQVARIPSVGAFFQARLQNTCNETMHVAYGYSTKSAGTALQVPWCTPGYAGLRSGTLTLSPWQSEGIAPLTYGPLDQIFWCACSDTNARAAFAEPVGLGVHNCRCRCASR